MHADDQIALIMLRTGLALPSGSPVAPFRARDWEQSRIGERLARRGLREGYLLGRSAAEISQEINLSAEFAERIASLLSRGAQLALERDRLQSRGIWILTRYDAEYPAVLEMRLGASAPPVLFGAGAKDLLSRRSVAVVGSRDVDAGGLTFTECLGRTLSNIGLTICSGGARGVDRTATQAALEAGGRAVSVLAEGVERPIRSKENVRPLLTGTHTMLSPYLPKAGFTVGNAMGRNRIVYCLSEAAIVVASAKENGGTWAGAVENLKANWVPLFVRMGLGVPDGNTALVVKGAHQVSDEGIAELLRRVERADWSDFADEAARSTSSRPADTLVAIVPGNGHGETSEAVHRSRIEREGGISLFDSVWPHLAEALKSPRTEAELAAAFSDLLPSQLKKWLKQAVEQGLVSADGHPTRYRSLESDRSRSGQKSLPLFT
jgi:predicted Rossmann fold nucleotide-binding protein DprA/Smf involved in DNA uptake